MGILQTSNQIVTNSMQLLDNVLNSNFTAFIQGQGTPVLVTYWNLNDTLSTTNSGTYTIDEELGSNSPIRYNKINDFPIYNLKEIILEIEEGEGEILDLNFETDVVILPNSIKPTEFDYFSYTFKNGRSITFRINNIKLGTIRNNDYYNLSIGLKDIDSDYILNKLNNQTVKEFKTNLNTIGTNDKCIIESTIFDKINSVTQVIKNITDQYIDLFYSEKYNAVILRGELGSDFVLYDPFLTQFIINTNTLDNDRDYIALVNFDGRHSIRKTYNKTFFRNIETRSNHIKSLKYSPTSFKNTDTNPFTYYGRETAFTLELYDDDLTDTCNNYMLYDFIKKMKNIDGFESYDYSTLELIIYRYINPDNDLNIVNDDEIEYINNLEISYSEYYYRIIPIVIFILNKYKMILNESYS